MNNETRNVDVCNAKNVPGALAMSHRIDRVKVPRHREYFNVYEITTAMIDMDGFYQGGIVVKGSSTESLVGSFKTRAEADYYVSALGRIGGES